MGMAGLLTVVSLVSVVLARTSSLASLQADASAPESQDEQIHNAPAHRTVAPSTFAALNHPDIDEHHRDLMEHALNELPSGCRWALKNVYVRSDNSVERAVGGSSTIIINGNMDDEEFVSVFIHEFGHITDLGCIRGHSAKPSAFRDGPAIIPVDDPSTGFYRISWQNERVQRTGSTPQDFVSGYASWDAFEDFGETYAYYVLHRDEFQKRAKTNVVLAAKLAWMEAHVFAGYEATATSAQAWDGSVPWDVTLLPYEWGV